MRWSLKIGIHKFVYIFPWTFHLKSLEEKVSAANRLMEADNMNMETVREEILINQQYVYTRDEYWDSPRSHYKYSMYCSAL